MSIKLCYRGINYEYQPSNLENKKTQNPSSIHHLKYRSATYNIESNTNSDISCICSKLNYRGSAYFLTYPNPQVSRLIAGHL